MSSIRVLVADDSALMRQTLKRMICAEPGMELAGTARDGEDAVAKARELRPDVITMDINMPKLDGITALQIDSGREDLPGGHGLVSDAARRHDYFRMPGTGRVRFRG